MRRAVLHGIAAPFMVLALTAPAAQGAEANAAPPAAAPGIDNSVIAVVNNYAISEYDLDQRIALFAATSGTQATKDTQPQIRVQVLHVMEDEVMELQEAQKHNITITNGDVEKAAHDLADHNHVTAEQMLATLMRAGVNIQTFTQYVATQLAWQRLVISRFGTGILADDQQLSDAKDRYLDELRRDGVIEMR